MTKLNKKIEYALIILKHLIEMEEGELSTTKEISNRYKTAFDVTAKVMRTLSKNGILNSIQGAYGGFKISCDLKQLTLLDLIETISGPVGIAKCMDGKCNQRGYCNVDLPIRYLNSKIIEFYENINLYQLLTVTEKVGMEQKVFIKLPILNI